MALLDTLETVTYGYSGCMTLEAAREVVRDSLSPCALSRSDGRILAVNDAWTALCGYSAEEVLHKSFSILQGPNTDAKRAKAFVTELHTCGKATTQLINYSKSGAQFAHVISACCVRDARRGCDGFYLAHSREWGCLDDTEELGGMSAEPRALASKREPKPTDGGCSACISAAAWRIFSPAASHP